MESERVAVDVNMTVKFCWVLIYVIFRLGRFRVCSLLIENVRSVFSSVCECYKSVRKCLPFIKTEHFDFLWSDQVFKKCAINRNLAKKTFRKLAKTAKKWSFLTNNV